MRAIVIIALVGLALVVALLVIGHGEGGLVKIEMPNEDSLDSWEKPKPLTRFAEAAWPLTPRAKFGVSTLTLAAGDSETLTNRSKRKGPSPHIQMAKVTVGSQPPGTTAGIAVCSKHDDSSCPTKLCLCIPGGPVNPFNPVLRDCPADFRAQAMAGKCPADLKSEVKLAVYPGKQLTLINVGGEPINVGLD
jgi:hypothetical protein